MLFIKPNAVKFLEQLTEKDYRIVSDHISRLECRRPPEGDLERLYGSRYRMHVARRYTIFLEHEGNNTTVLKIMTIGQAHKRYGRI